MPKEVPPGGESQAHVPPPPPESRLLRGGPGSPELQADVAPTLGDLLFAKMCLGYAIARGLNPDLHRGHGLTITIRAAPLPGAPVSEDAKQSEISSSTIVAPAMVLAALKYVPTFQGVPTGPMPARPRLVLPPS